MARTVETYKRQQAIHMIQKGVGQHEIAEKVGISRPYIRKLAAQLQHQFPRNGYEIKPPILSCFNCGAFFRRPKSKTNGKKTHFCSVECKQAYSTGENHPNWKGGVSSRTFSQWAQNQSEYSSWRKRALERAGHKCEITGKTTNLDVHHIKPKALVPEMVFDDTNALVLCEEAHDRVHAVLREGHDYEKAVEIVRKEFKALEKKVNRK